VERGERRACCSFWSAGLRLGQAAQATAVGFRCTVYSRVTLNCIADSVVPPPLEGEAPLPGGAICMGDAIPSGDYEWTVFAEYCRDRGADVSAVPGSAGSVCACG
jgi:hypothetical protein